jgi:membrane protease YdiL (CAAX protease family)
LAGPAAIAWASEAKALGAPLVVAMAAQAALLLLAGAILAAALLWQGLEPASLGLKSPTWGTLWHGLALAALFVLGLGPVLMRLPAWLGLRGFQLGFERLARLPTWYLYLAVLVGGIVEELLYRGYAFDRLQLWTGSAWLAGSISVGAFALAHLPLWGPGPALTLSVSGAVLTGAYAWHGDLLANILAHVLTDALGILAGVRAAARISRAAPR